MFSITRRIAFVLKVVSLKYSYIPEWTMGQWVMGHGSDGSHKWMGQMGHGSWLRDP